MFCIAVVAGVVFRILDFCFSECGLWSMLLVLVYVRSSYISSNYTGSN